MTTRNDTLDNLLDCLETLSDEFGNRRTPVPTAYLDLHYHACDLADDLDDQLRYEGNALGISWLVEHYNYADALADARRVADQVRPPRDASTFRLDDDRRLE